MPPRGLRIQYSKPLPIGRKMVVLQDGSPVACVKKSESGAVTFRRIAMHVEGHAIFPEEVIEPGKHAVITGVSNNIHTLKARKNKMVLTTVKEIGKKTQTLPMFAINTTGRGNEFHVVNPYVELKEWAGQPKK